MITWTKKKHYENKAMLVPCKTIASLLSEQKDAFTLLSNLYISLKGTPVGGLKSEFTTESAKIIHESAEQERVGNEQS